MLASMQSDPGIASTILGKLQQPCYQAGGYPRVWVLERCHVKPDCSAEWRWLDPNALKRLQKFYDNHPCNRRLPRDCVV